MPDRIPERADRLRACRLFIEMARLVTTDIFGTDRNWGGEVDATVVGCAVLIGQAEGKPMSANKLALYLGMPRTTVVRKLRLLLDLNAVVQDAKGMYLISPVRTHSARDRALVAKIVKLIDRAASKK